MMGYISTFTGQIIIDPPLKYVTIKDYKYALKNNEYAVKIEIHEEYRDTDEGLLVLNRGIAIVPNYESCKGYSILKELNEIARDFPNHNYSGEIRAEGEEAGDIRKYVFKNGKFEEIKAEITWPDE